MGSGNQLKFIGARQAFRRSNEAIEPAPPAQYFRGGNGKK
jgi:hypothetical protein